MGNFSRDTFNALNRYVGVRLQQGVPLVDADWNEQEDIRRFELEAFLRWFVGNGVPEGNDGFRIMNVLSRSPDITAEEIIDFVIRGGDGTPKGAGRCLVEGWEVINESNIRYTEQPLFEDPDLAARWGVALLPSLEAPAAARTDTVYLDVWEREVDSEEDPNLVNSAIGIETCVRKKREWVVRVETGATEPPADRPKGHVFYPLAYLNYPGQPGTSSEGRGFTITDLRRTGLSLMPKDDIRQITIDAFGPSYTLDHDGQPNLRVSLRDAINAILLGEIPGTPELKLTDAETGTTPYLTGLVDSRDDIWVFWTSVRDEGIWYKLYKRDTNTWGNDTRLTGDRPTYAMPFAIEDNNDNIWVFWTSPTNEGYSIRGKMYDRNSGTWRADEQLSTDEGSALFPFPIKDRDDNMWVFWQQQESIRYRRYNSANGVWGSESKLTEFGGWFSVPFAVQDGVGNILVFWMSVSGGNSDIWYRRYDRASNTWEDQNRQLTVDEASDMGPSCVMKDKSNDIWVFWTSQRGGTETNAWYKKYSHASGRWGADTKLTGVRSSAFAVEDSQGGIWAFWSSPIGSSRIGQSNVIQCKRYDPTRGWGDTMQLTKAPDSNDSLFRGPILYDKGRSIWLFWTRQPSDDSLYYIWYREFVLTI